MNIDIVQLQIGKKQKAVPLKIVMQIKNTVDCHATEKAFNKLLHSSRADILPPIAENWCSSQYE